MIFVERKTGTAERPAFEYTCEDIFGQVVIESPERLQPDLLDLAIMGILAVHTRTGTLAGMTARPKPGTPEAQQYELLEAVQYRFDPARQWEDDADTVVPARRPWWPRVRMFLARLWRALLPSLAKRVCRK